MSVFIIIALPMLAVGLILLFLAARKKDKAYLVPGFVLLVCSFVNAVMGISLSTAALCPGRFAGLTGSGRRVSDRQLEELQPWRSLVQ